MSDIVRVARLSKSYGPIKAVAGLSFTVAKGEIFGMIGPDGAGKTTTLRTLATLLRPDSGEVMVAGLDARTEVAAIRAIIGYMPQRFSLYPDLSIDQNLRFFAELFGVPADKIAERKQRLYEFSKLAPFAKRLAGRLSGGMKQKLALSCTLIHDPVLLVLDEPTTGVDPVSRNELWAILRELRAEGVTIIVSTPYMDEAMYCDRMIIMHQGGVLAEGAPSRLPDLVPDAVYALQERSFAMRPELFAVVDGVRGVHSFGDSLHLNIDIALEEATVRERLTRAAGRPVSLRRVTPTLEDVFIHLVEEGERRAG
jgi:ABC-2 type transport system ATP-binding protein